MHIPSPHERDHAQRRVRAITMATAAGAGVLTLAGAAAAAGTFSGRTVGTDQSNQQPSSGAGETLQQPDQQPGFSGGDQAPVAVSGAS